MNMSATLLCEGECIDVPWTFATVTVVQSNKMNMLKNVSWQFICLYANFLGQSLSHFGPAPIGILPNHFWAQYALAEDQSHFQQAV